MDGGWRIELLGELRARRGDQVVTRFQKQLAASLLAYLACHPQYPHTRDALLEALCPDLAMEDARNSLRVALHLLRRQLEPPGTPEPEPLLIADRRTIRLNPAAFTTDVAEFEAALRAAARAASPDEQLSLLPRAVELYRGELLAGFTEEWVFTERQHRAEQYLDALHRLVTALEQTGNLESALEYGRQAVSADPLREEAHYDLMRLYAAAGQPSATLQQYQELERLLREELNEKPSAAARALAEELRRNARTIVVARSARAVDAPSSPAGTPPSPVIPSAGPSVTPAPAPRLPPQFTLFFGREEEIARVTELLCIPETRLVTLTGPGGSGKTRLAIAAAGRLQEVFGGAVAFVPLADLTEAHRITDAVADALSLARSAEVEPLEQVVEALCSLPWLLVLDNFEHLVEDGALLVRTLLERAAGLTCLVTSRRRLNLVGEQEFVVLPLPTPRRSDPPERLRECISVQLFIDRARAVRPEFQVTETNAAAVAALCDRLEGLPLALELAAARSPMLTPAQMLAHLEQRFELLVSRQRDLPARHRTLRATVDGSYQLLSAELRRLLARLSVFRGGWTLEAAAVVCSDFGFWILDFGLGNGPTDARGSRSQERPESQGSEAVPSAIQNPKSKIQNTLDCLEQLREASLILAEEQGDAVRYRLLETLREYAWERLADSGDRTVVRNQHRDWYLQLAERAEPELSGRHAREWLDRLEREHDNLRAALHWSLEAGQGEPALRLAGTLAPFWEMRRDLSEGRAALGAVLALPEAATPNGERARLLYDAGLLARTQEDRSAALAYWTEALAIRRQIGDRKGTAAVLTALAEVEDQVMNRAAATALLEESLVLWRELEDRAGQARSLRVLARIATEHEALPAARAMYEEALTLDRGTGNQRGQLADLHGLGSLAVDQGDYPVARAALEEVLALQRELGDRWGTAGTLFYLGRIAFDLGDYEAARQLWEETLVLDLEKMGEGGYVTLCLGWLLEVQGDVVKARESYEAFIEKERRVGSKTGVPGGMIALGDLALECGDEATARAWYEKSLAIYRGMDSEIDWVRITLPYELWHLARRQGDVAAAQSFQEEILSLHRSLEGQPRAGWLLHYRGVMARYEGDYEEARTLHGQSAALFRDLGQWKGLAACLEGEAGLAAAQEQMVRAARLCGAAAALRERAGRTRTPIDRMDYEATVAAARAALGEEAFAAAWAEGRAMSLEQSVCLAFEESEIPAPGRTGS